MTYIKLLTVLAGLALLTACGGGTGLTATNDTITPECMTNPFGDGCNRFAEALASQEIMCLADATADPSCVGDAGIATVFCKANPFNTSKACVADTGAIALRQTMCLASATTDDSCGAVIEGVCMDDPFHSNNTCMADTYLPNRIAECIKGGEADEGKCATITTDAEKNTMVIGCLENPFDIVCQTSVTDFVTYADTARMNRLDFCDDNANVANDFCTGNNVTIICEVDPFNAICFTDDTYLSDRAEDCIMAGNAGESKCNNLFTASASNTCLTNPFADACASNADFMTYANMARTNRLTFCNDSDNVANGLCTGANLMNVCVADPFNAICFTDATYLPARITNCITGGNAGDMKCDTIVSDSTMNTELTDCLENPFATACESVSAFTTFALARTNRVSFCEIGGNESNALCMDTTLTNLCEFNPFSTACIGHPDTPDLQVASCSDVNNNNKDPSCTEVGLVKENDLPAYPALPVATTRRGFLEGGTAGIDTTGFTRVPTGDGSLNATATAGSGEDMVSLGGAATDGVAWAEIRLDNGILNYYAGIFSGTNMGATLVKPATATGAMVDWKGVIQGNNILDNLIGSPTPFTLNVDLFNRTLKAYVSVDSDTIFAFSIDGVYDAKGLISGEVLRGIYTNSADPTTFRATNTAGTQPNTNNHTGILTGLIGAKGAVGVFHSNTLAGAYSGGFLAVPTPLVVNNAAWLASFKPELRTEALSTAVENSGGRFLQGTPNGINAGSRTLNTFSFDTAFDDDNTTDGFAFFTGVRSISYAGIFSGTNLGAPVVASMFDSENKATWSGFIRGGNLFGTATAFDLNVVFTGTGGTLVGFIPHPTSTITNIAFTIDGFFDEKGVITGTVERGVYMDTRIDEPVRTGGSAGTLSGLIGQEGAVGVFVSDANVASVYSGGFVAKPPE